MSVSLLPRRGRENGETGYGAKANDSKLAIPADTSSSFDCASRCNYSTYMKSTQIKIVRIGNSRGVRLPAASLRRYHIGETVIMEERSEGILLRPTGPTVAKLSWQDTSIAMAASEENWSDWDSTSDDGLAAIPWEGAERPRVAETKARYAVSKSSKRR